jgi:hypothetical protein
MRDRNEKAMFDELLDQLAGVTARYTGGDWEAAKRGYWTALRPFGWPIVNAILTAALSSDTTMPTAADLAARCRARAGERNRGPANEALAANNDAARLAAEFKKAGFPYVLIPATEPGEFMTCHRIWPDTLTRYSQACDRLPEWADSHTARAPIPPCLHTYESGVENCTVEKIHACFLGMARLRSPGPLRLAR